MKLKILFAFLLSFALAAVIVPSTAEAQYITRSVKDSVVNAGTTYITFTSTPNLVKGISLTGVLSTGTLSTTVTLESRIDTISGSTDWVTVPASVSNVATATATSSTVVQWHLSGHTANGYRIKVVGAGTQKTYLYGSVLRRTQ